MAATGDLDLQGIARRVRAFRKVRGMTREALAAKSGLSVTTLQSLEKGMREPELRSVVAVAAALDVPVGDLIGGEG